MTTPVATASITIVPDFSGFAGQLRRDINTSLAGVQSSTKSAAAGISNNFRNATASAGKDFDLLSSKARISSSGISASFKASAIGIGVAFAAIKVGSFFKDAVTEASNLNESINAIKVLLGSGADSFLEFGKSAADNLGIAQQNLNALVTPTAALLKNAGLTGEALSGSLQELATRATDVGSVVNASAGDVLEGFNAALRGEFDTLEKFGVSLKQSAVNQKAVELGLAETTSQVSTQASALAAYQLVLEKSSFAAGDFAKTQDGVANSGRIIAANFAELKATIGTTLLPAVQVVQGALIPALEAVAPALGTVAQAIGQTLVALAPALESLGPILADTFTALAPALEPLGQAFADVFTALGPLLPVLAQLVTTALVPLSGVLSEVATALAPMIALFAQFADQVLASFAPLFPPLIAAFQDAASAIGDQLVVSLQQLLPQLLQVFQALLPLVPVFVQVTLAALPLIPPLLELATAILNVLLPAINAILPVFTSLATGIGGVFASTIGQVVGFINTLIDVATAAINKAIDLYNKIPFVGDIDKGAGASFVGTPAQNTGFEQDAASITAALQKQGFGASTASAGIPASAAAGALAASKALDNGASSAKAAADKLKKSIADVRKEVNALAKGTSDQTVDEIKRGFDSLVASLKDAGLKQYVAQVRAVEKTLVGLARQRDKLNDQLNDAKDNLKSLKDESSSFADSVRSAVNDLGNVAQESQGIATTFVGIRQQLISAIGTTRQFSAAIASLTAAGLNQTSLRQLIEAGPAAGLDAARALLSGGVAGVQEVNQLQAQLDAQGQALGASVANTFYAAGIQAAAGLVAGLQSQEAAIEAQMNRIADRMAKAIKKALQIKSPSALLAREVGVPAGQGIVGGLVKEIDRMTGVTGAVRNYASNVTFGPGSVVAHGATEAGASRMGTGLGLGIKDVLERQLAQAMIDGHG